MVFVFLTLVHDKKSPIYLGPTKAADSEKYWMAAGGQHAFQGTDFVATKYDGLSVIFIVSVTKNWFKHYCRMIIQLPFYIPPLILIRI